MVIDLAVVWLLKIVPIVLGLVFLIRGIRVLALSFISRRWPRVEGEIVTSEVAEISLPGAGEIIHASSGYVPQVKYQFPLNGRTLHGQCIAFGEKITGAPYSAAKALADSYQPGAKVTVFYHPQKPSIATLRPGKTASSFISFLVGSGLICLGVLIS